MTTAPERIHVNWNSADGIKRFREIGIEAIAANGVTPEQLTDVLAAQQGRLFRLMGFVGVEVALRVDGRAGNRLTLTNTDQPPFTGDYVVAHEPPPYIDGHGDYRFDLQRTN